MSEYVIMPKSDYIATVDAIRSKTGKTDPIKSGDLLSEISPLALPAPEIKLQEKTITENGEYTADSGFDGLGKVTVEVTGSGGSADVRYVTFMSYDGLIEYGKKAVAVGDDCADPIARGVFATPTRESDVQYNYTFYGWATEPNGGAVSNWNKAITEDKTVYANFSSAVRYYTITYYDSDGTTVLKTESLAYGATPSYVPEKNGYKFVAWNPKIAEVTGDASYTCSWAEQLKLADYTWGQIDAMTIAEMRDNFSIGDIKDNYMLVGFEQDTLSTGSKARMSFISTNLKGYTTLGFNVSTYHDLSHYKDPNSTPTKVHEYDKISAVAKNVRKKYVTNRSNLTIGEETIKFWAPSASELGYKVDGTTILDEGEKYDLFIEKTISDKQDGKNLALGKRFLRSVNGTEVLYLDSGYIKKCSSTAVKSVYYSFGFCI